MTVAIVDYGSGNLRSAEKAFESVARERGRGERIMVTARPELVAAADRIVLPGVGAFGDCRRGLAAIDGMIAALEEAVTVKARPFLGICVGMQLMAKRGLEYGEHLSFGWIDGEVARLAPLDPALKVPHMGWNDLRLTPAGRAHPVLQGFVGDTGGHAYFVHSYAMRCARDAEVLAEVDYGGRVVAAVGRGTMIGVQFHPEKSQAAGLDLIARFLDWRP